MPSITVLIPAFNEEKLIRRCLESILAQEPQPDEILVVDNASTDSTADIIRAVMAENPTRNVQMIYEAKKGCPAAREAGWRAAQGDIIIHVDADEIFPAGWLKQIHDVLHQQPELDAFGGTVIFENAPPSIKIFEVLYNLFYARVVQWTKGFPYLCGGMTITKRSVLEAIGGFAARPDNELEDYYFSRVAHEKGFKLRYIPSIYGIHSLRRYEEGGMKGFLQWGVSGLDANQYDPDVR